MVFLSFRNSIAERAGPGDFIARTGARELRRQGRDERELRHEGWGNWLVGARSQVALGSGMPGGAKLRRMGMAKGNLATSGIGERTTYVLPSFRGTSNLSALGGWGSCWKQRWRKRMRDYALTRRGLRLHGGGVEMRCPKAGIFLPARRTAAGFALPGTLQFNPNHHVLFFSHFCPALPGPHHVASSPRAGGGFL